MKKSNKIDFETIKFIFPAVMYLVSLSFAAGILWFEIRSGNESTKKLITSHNKLAIELFKGRFVDSIYIVVDKGIDTLGRENCIYTINKPITDHIIAYVDSEDEKRKRITNKETACDIKDIEQKILK